MTPVGFFRPTVIRSSRSVIVSRPEAMGIRSGRKTQHRFPRSRTCPQILASVPVSYRERNAALGFEKDGQPKLQCVKVCRIQVLKVEEAPVAEVTTADAQREGFASVADCRAIWGELPPRTPMWVMRFRVDPIQRPRYLSQTIIAGRQGAYCESTLRALDEVEAVDDEALDVLTQQARVRDMARYRERRDLIGTLTFDEQLAHFITEARERYIDIRSEVRAIRRWTDQQARDRQLARIRRKLEVQVAA